MRFLQHLRRFAHWLGVKGSAERHDLGLVDEIFAIFAGATLVVANTDWLKDGHTDIIYTIFVSVGLVALSAVMVVNQPRFWPRALLNLLTLAIAVEGIEAVMQVSRHDLAPQRGSLDALAVGVIAWVAVRESAIFLMNVLPDFKQKASHHAKTDA